MLDGRWRLPRIFTCNNARQSSQSNGTVWRTNFSLCIDEEERRVVEIASIAISVLISFDRAKRVCRLHVYPGFDNFALDEQTTLCTMSYYAFLLQFSFYHFRIQIHYSDLDKLLYYNVYNSLKILLFRGKLKKNHHQQIARTQLKLYFPFFF